MSIDRLAAIHRRANRRWYRQIVTVDRPTGTGWEARPDVRGTIQYRYAYGSSADPDFATASDAETAIFFCDPSSDIQVGYRVTNPVTGTVWNVTAVGDERTTAGTMPVTLVAAEMAVPGERIVFYRKQGDGTYGQVADIVVQFIEQPTDVRSSDHATGILTSGTMRAGSEAAGIVAGDYFSRNGAPGRVLHVEHDTTTGRVDLAYTVEGS